MDLLNENAGNKGNQTKQMKLIRNLLIISIILFVIVIAALVIMKKEDKSKNEITLSINDEAQKLQTSIFLEKETGEKYIYIKDLMQYFAGSNYYNGEVNSIDEDKTKGYIEFANGRIVGFSKDSNEIYKTTINTKTERQIFNIEYPIIENEGRLMVEFNDISLALNLVTKFDVKTKTLTVYTDEFAKTKYNTVAVDNGYEGINTDNENYNLLSYGYVVVTKNKKMGLQTLEMTEVLGCKYDKISFVEETKNLNVTTGGKTGIMNLYGKAKIPAEYDEINIMKHDDIEYYLVKQNNKNGILDSLGETIITSIYDSIEILEVNNNLYYVVKINGLYGLINQEGIEIKPPIYNNIGFKGKENTATLDLKTIELEDNKFGLVVMQNNLYGIINIETGEEIIPCVASKIYKNDKNVNMIELPDSELSPLPISQYINFIG